MSGEEITNIRISQISDGGPEENRRAAGKEAIEFTFLVSLGMTI